MTDVVPGGVQVADKKPTDFVVVFGQMRDDYACLEKIYGFYKDRPDTRIILTTWKNKGKKVDGLYGPSQLRLVFGDEVARSIPYHVQGSKFYNFYPGLRAKMSLDGEFVTEEEVCERFPGVGLDIENESFNLDFTQIKGDLNSKRLLYKWWRGVRLVEQICKHENLTPRKLMLIRTDRMPANPAVLDVDVEDNDFYIDKWGEVTAGDMMLVSRYSNIRGVASLFHLCEMEPERPWGGIHREMNQRVRELGLNPISNPEYCDVKNFNTLGVFEQVAREYMADPTNHVHPHVAYSNTFLNALDFAKQGKTEEMQSCLDTLAKANFKEDVTVWLAHYLCAHYTGDLEWATQAITTAILVAVRNSVAFLKKESLRPNDTYLVSMFIHTHRQQFGTDEVFESEKFAETYQDTMKWITSQENNRWITLTDAERDSERFVALVREIYK